MSTEDRETSTRRLRELVEKKANADKALENATEYQLQTLMTAWTSALGELTGYKKALADVAPVLAFVDAEIAACRWCIAEKNGTGGCSLQHRSLRNALSELRDAA